MPESGHLIFHRYDIVRMVKWGETVEKLAMKSSFLFQRTDFVQYDSLNPE